MEENKRLRRDDFISTVVFKSITLYASRGSLWSRTGVGHRIDCDASNFTPVLKIHSSFKPSLQRLLKDSSYMFDIDRYIKAVSNPLSPSELEFQEIQFFSRTGKDEVLIQLVHSEDIEKKVFDGILEDIMKKIDNYEEKEFLLQYDLCVPLIQYYEYKNSLKTYFHLVYPSVSFSFQQIAGIKIVSTSLSLSLTNKEKYTYKFQTGYATMDQKKRILPLKTNDKHIFKYPLVGVWASGIRGDVYQNPLILCSFIRFIESQAVHERISPSPSTNTFLFVYFSPKPYFYEVSTQGKSSWKLVSKPMKANSMYVRFTEDDTSLLAHTGRTKKNMTISTSSSEGKYNKTRTSFESDTTEKMILKHNVMLRNLEKQINDLQNVLSEPRYSNAETNTTSLFNYSKDSAMRFSNRRQSAVVRESRESVPMINPLQNSCNYETRNMKSDATIAVPRIIYKPDSDSDEDYELNFIA